MCVRSLEVTEYETLSDGSIATFVSNQDPDDITTTTTPPAVSSAVGVSLTYTTTPSAVFPSVTSPSIPFVRGSQEVTATESEVINDFTIATLIHTLDADDITTTTSPAVSPSVTSSSIPFIRGSQEVTEYEDLGDGTTAILGLTWDSDVITTTTTPSAASSAVGIPIIFTTTSPSVTSSNIIDVRGSQEVTEYEVLGDGTTATFVLTLDSDDITTTTAPPAFSPSVTFASSAVGTPLSYTVAEDVTVSVPQVERRVFKRSQDLARLLLPRPRLEYCSPPTATHYLTVTSTLVIPSLTYATLITYIPTVISQVSEGVLLFVYLSFGFITPVFI